MKTLKIYAIAAYLLLCLSVIGNAQETAQLTNNDVVTMMKSGLSPEVIAAKIKNTNNKFDTSPSALKTLKESGVPDSILLAMVQTPVPTAVNTEASAPIDKNAKVKVYVYRRKEFNTRNMQPSVFVDGNEVARMDDGKFFIVMLEPGKHKLFVNKEFSGADIDMKPGEDYYFRVSMKPGFWKARGEVEYVPKEQGAFEMNKMNPLETKWIKDKSVSVENIKEIK